MELSSSPSNLALLYLTRYRHLSAPISIFISLAWVQVAYSLLSLHSLGRHFLVFEDRASSWETLALSPIFIHAPPFATLIMPHVDGMFILPHDGLFDCSIAPEYEIDELLTPPLSCPTVSRIRF